MSEDNMIGSKGNIAEIGNRETMLLEDIEEQEHVIESIVASSLKPFCINNNFSNVISSVDREVDRLDSKLEQYGVLGIFMMSVGACDCKTGHHVDESPIGTDYAYDITDDSLWRITTSKTSMQVISNRKKC